MDLSDCQLSDLCFSKWLSKVEESKSSAKCRYYSKQLIQTGGWQLGGLAFHYAMVRKEKASDHGVKA